MGYRVKQIDETTPNGHKHEPVNQGDFLESPIIVNGAMLAGHPGVHLADSETWRKWSRMRLACLWEAVALHCYLDPHPRYMTKNTISSSSETQAGSAARLFQERFAIARHHGSDGTLKIRGLSSDDFRDRGVRLSDYAQWAQGLDMTLPPHFPTTPTTNLTTPAMWPWGTHDTVLLGHLAATAHHFWKPVSEGGNYDPERPITAKSNDVITAWLMKRGVSENMAKAIPTLLHADDMAKGPRATHRKKVG